MGSNTQDKRALANLMKFFERFKSKKEHKPSALKPDQQQVQEPEVEALPPEVEQVVDAELSEVEQTVEAPLPEVEQAVDAPLPEVEQSAEQSMQQDSADTIAADERHTGEQANDQQETKTRQGLFSRLKAGLKRTSSNFSDGMGALLLGKKEIDDDLLEELETQLLVADVGIEATQEIITNLTKQVSRKELADAPALYKALQGELASLLATSKPLQVSSNQPYVILMVGVNGVGKTTTIGKLAKRFQEEGKSVMLAAGDTFRAAAVEQLQVWGERNSVPVVAQHTGADSASVIYDALQAAQARNIDVLIADTAGRLHNKDNLMEELKKVVRVMGKLDDSAPHEVMLVLDAGTGQNALSQATHFQAAVGVSGITLTKLDGTAKGGIIFAISKQLQLPIRFIGVGEQVDDLRPFVAQEFVDALFNGQGFND
jgi:fused signal recognition particle receptor